MGKMESKWYNVPNVPTSFEFPEEDRPGDPPIPISHTIPVIDLGKSNMEAHTIHQIIKASQEFGFFQVINHGVSDEIIHDTTKIYKDFFEMPDEKASRNIGGKSNWVYTSSTGYNKDGVHLWRENIKHPCHPLKHCMQQWPENPTRYREVVSTYVAEVNKLSTRILDFICKGLGLQEGYFQEICEAGLLSANTYPPCPNPNLTLGILKHHDPSIITILYQGNVPGLQVTKDGNWIGVGAMPNAFVVNIGNQLEIISNGILRSAEHRAVTNSRKTRSSVAVFINPSPSCVVEPAQVLVNELNPAKYKARLYKEFVYSSKAFGTDTEIMQRA